VDHRSGDGQLRLAFVVNDVATEEPGYTTTRLGIAATNRGHEAWVIGVGDLAYDPDERIKARARRVHRQRYKTGQTYLRDLRSRSAIQERVTVDDLDVLMLRNDPSTEKGKREWAKTAAIDFGRVAMRHGVIVLNDPNGLAKA
jgi:glutathione synthase